MRKREAGPLSHCINKRRYETYEFALEQIKKISAKKQMRCYLCGICNGYHCTSKIGYLHDVCRNARSL